MKLSIDSLGASSDKLLEQAEHYLKSKISEDLENTNYLLRLVQVLRERGNFIESMKYISRILELEPENRSAIQLDAIFNQKIIEDNCKNDYCPAPFLYIENFLSVDELQQIWNLTLINEKKFEDSKILQEKLDINTRQSITLYSKNLKDISAWLLEKITSKFSNICPLLYLESSFDPKLTEIQLTRHGNNDFYNIHRDSSDTNNKTKTRTLTFVYYFHKEPKYFRGGEILLFDTSTKENNFNTRFTKLTPKNNSIVFFPSDFYHQVTPVSLQEDKFENGRFAIHGWFHQSR